MFSFRNLKKYMDRLSEVKVMKKYTIIYRKNLLLGAVSVEMKRIEFDESETTLEEYLKSMDDSPAGESSLLDDTVFIFEGHPMLEGEKDTVDATNRNFIDLVVIAASQKVDGKDSWGVLDEITENMDQKRKNSKEKKYVVEFKVNGVKLPFLKTWQEVRGRMHHKIEEKIRKEAEKIVLDEGLGKVNDLLEDVRCDLREFLYKKFPDADL